jgi:hypothetical protein
MGPPPRRRSHHAKPSERRRASRAPRAASEVTAKPARGCFAISVGVEVMFDVAVGLEVDGRVRGRGSGVGGRVECADGSWSDSRSTSRSGSPIVPALQLQSDAPAATQDLVLAKKKKLIVPPMRRAFTLALARPSPVTQAPGLHPSELGVPAERNTAVDRYECDAFPVFDPVPDAWAVLLKPPSMSTGSPTSSIAAPVPRRAPQQTFSGPSPLPLFPPETMTTRSCSSATSRRSESRRASAAGPCRSGCLRQ